eukprot:EG_transcript_18818
MFWDDTEETRLPLPDILSPNADTPRASLAAASASEPCRTSALSEEVQRSHFCAFFAAEHRIRRPLPPNAPFSVFMDILIDGLHKMQFSAPWLRLQLHLKARSTLRKGVRRLALARAGRRETLDGWLSYWDMAEAKIQGSFRQQLQSSATMQDALQRAQRGIIARAVTPMADALKAQVIWELYWILQAQHEYRVKRQAARLVELLAQRTAILQRRSCGMDTSSGMDFWQGKPMSLRATNAAIFLLLLQEPKYDCVVGRDIKVNELLRLANAHLADGAWGSPADSPLGPHTSPTLLAFLRSPLLTEPQWLKSRSKQAGPLIPPRTWVPAKCLQDTRPASARLS